MEFKEEELDIKDEPLFLESPSTEPEDARASDSVDPFASFVTMECKKNDDQLDVNVKIKEEPLSAESEQLFQSENETVPFAGESKSYISLTTVGHQIDKDIKIKKELPEPQQSNVAGAEAQSVTVPSTSGVAANSEKDGTDPNIDIKEEPLFPEGESACSEAPPSSDTDIEMSPKQRRYFSDMDALLERLGDNSELSELSDDEEDELSRIPARRGLGESSESSSSDEDIWLVSSKQRRCFGDMDALLERMGENSELSELSDDEDDDEDKNFQITASRRLEESSESSSSDEHICPVSSKSTLASYTVTTQAASSMHQEPLFLKSKEVPCAKTVDMEEPTTTTTPSITFQSISDLALATASKPILNCGQYKAEEIKLLQNQLPNGSGTAAGLKRKKLWFKKPFKGKPCPDPLNLSNIQNPEPVRTPLQYFSEYFDEEFFDLASNCTNIELARKSGKITNTSASELKQFFAVNLVMGAIKYPRLRMYWQKGYKLAIISECMSRERFLSLRNNIHVVDTANPPPDRDINRLWKIQPVIDTVRRGCLNLPRDSNIYSVGEQRIPFTGLYNMEQLEKNARRPVNLKLFVITSSFGFVLDFEIFQRPDTPLVNTALGLGPSIVMRLIQTIPRGSFIFFGRYFTTLPLLEKLTEVGMEGTGTIKPDRMKDIKCKDDSKLKRSQSIEYVRGDDKIVVVEWQDTGRVALASTCFGIQPQEPIKMWSKIKKAYVEGVYPFVVHSYNQCMGGLNLCNQQMESYQTCYKIRRWSLKCILHFLNLSVVNCWFKYKHDVKSKIPRKNHMDLFHFRLELAKALISTLDQDQKLVSESDSADVEPATPPKRSKYFNPPNKVPEQEKRHDSYGHWPVIDNIISPRKCRMEGCKSRTKTRCNKCNIYLCLSKYQNCFKNFHVS